MNYQNREQAIKKRIAEKDAMMLVMNASNAASGIAAALLELGEKEPALKLFEKLRNDILTSNMDAIEELKNRNYEYEQEVPL